MMRRLLAAGLLCLIAQLAQAQAVTILGAEFGVFESGKPGELVFEPTLSIPHKLGQRYGWIIELRTAKRSVAVREEYLLPSAASEAGPHGNLKNDATLNIPLPRRSQVSQRQLVPTDGRIYGEWSIGPGEPAGRRHLQVIVEGQLAGSFEYEVR
jgi:hypothetical protein